MEPAEDRALRLVRPVETPVPVLLPLVPVPPTTTAFKLYNYKKILTKIDESCNLASR